MLFISLSLFSQKYPTFTPNELIKIKNENIIAKNRIIDYQNYIKACQDEPKSRQLNKVNFYLNRLLPQYDDVIQKQEDNWATPKEFLTIGYGDCEDYVLIKYYSLIKLGFDEKKLFITVVKERFRGGQHMVLTYFQYKNRAPLVLDNLSFKILNLQQREDLNAELFINSTGIYKPSKNFQLIKVAHKLKEFEELKEKVKNNH